jgi:spermidine synthase/Tfp pilus assembly protein PilF
MSNQPARRWPLWLAAFVTVFIANAAIMTIELVAGRVVSPHIGMSLYTWTSIIGVVMAGMSVGHYLGGWLADRFRARRTLGLLFLLGAAGAVSILFTNDIIGQWEPLRGMAWPLRIFLHTGLMFLLPALLLGAIAPVVAKMALYGGKDAGRVMGGVFASGVAGSIAGTFLTGFFLVATFPVPAIVITASAVLALVGILYFASVRKWPEPAPEPLVESQHADHLVKQWRFAEWFPPNATVFMSNFGFMAIEIAAMRMVSREFGASLYTWTSVIGVVLAGVTLGNALGGRLAARRAGAPTVMTLFVFAAFTSLAIPPLGSLIRDAISENYELVTLPWSLQILLYTTLTFLLPNIFIGMISPVVVKRALAQGHAAGRTVGNIYAWGAVGSITATFLSGYALIDWLGPIPLIVATALILALVGLAYRRTNPLPIAATAAAATLLLLTSVNAGPFRQVASALHLREPVNPNIIYEDETQYSYVAVIQDSAEPHIRTLKLDTLVHTTVDLLNPLNLRYEYEQVYETVLNHRYPAKQPLRSLTIGGGGYAFPHYLEVTRPGSHVEVAEIDPAVTEAAFEVLGLPRETNIEIHNEDARNRIEDLLNMKEDNQAFEPFDCIFGDSFNDYTVPYHLTTLEFTQDIHSLLKPDGIYLLNCIDIFNSGQFVGAMINTLSQVFESVHVFSTFRAPSQRDTFVLIGCKTACDLEPLRVRTTMLPESAVAELKDRSNGMALTDNYAPVENLLAPVVRTQGGKIGERYFQEAQRAAAAGDLDRALNEAQRAVEAHPIWPEAWTFIANLRQETGDHAGAVEAAREALNGNTNPARAHHNLAQILSAAGQNNEAADQWRQAAELEPENVNHVYNLGLAYAGQQQMDQAIKAWERAHEIAPDHRDTMHNLALAYFVSQDYDNAWNTIDQITRSGDTPDPALIEELNKVAPRAGN